MAARENGLTDRLSLSLSLSPSRTLVTPYCKRIRPGRRITRAAVPSFVPPCVPSRADPSGLGHAATIYSSVQGPPGVETPTNKYSDYIVTFSSIHYVIIYVIFFGACMRCTRLCPLKPGCYRSGIRGMLTVGRNLDRNGQTLIYLPYSDSFLNIS